MSSTISLTASTRTCVVDVGNANRVQSDRFQNPNNMVCIGWNNTDLTGREVDANSFYTKTPGCNSSEDRISVENDLRPSYFSYITLSGSGLDGNIYGNVDAASQVAGRQAFVNSRNQVTGNYGLNFSADLSDAGNCSVNAYEKAMAQQSQGMRAQGALQNGYQASSNRKCSGI